MSADAQVWWFEHERGLTATETEAFLERQMRLWEEFDTEQRTDTPRGASYIPRSIL